MTFVIKSRYIFHLLIIKVYSILNIVNLIFFIKKGQFIMRDKISALVTGFILIGIGVLIGGDILNLWRFSIFFPGWWTLFIIIPCVYSAIRYGFNTGNVIGLAIGLVLLSSQQAFLRPYFSWKLVVPIALIVIGIAVIVGIFNPNYKNTCNYGEGTHYKGGISDEDKVINATVKETSENDNTSQKAAHDFHDIPEIVAIFGGQDRNFSNVVFHGANIISIFGGSDINLRDAIIPENCTINCTNIFGGSDIFFPPNVNVKIIPVSIFGGTSNQAGASSYQNAATVTVRSTCIFGGTDLKR